MTEYSVHPEMIKIETKGDALSTYEFGSKVAKHHFCNQCGIYTFHQTMSKPGHYRINIGCLEGIDSASLAFDVFDGVSI